MKTSGYTILLAGIFLVLSQTMVGINIVGTKYLVATVPMLFILAVRFSIGTVMLFTLHWLTDRHPHNIRRHTDKLSRTDWLFIIAQALTAGILFNLLMIYGLRLTPANVAGIITSTLPALIAVMCWIALREKFTYKKVLCVAFATIGLIVISVDKLTAPAGNNSLFGIGIIILAMLPEATYYVLTKMHTNRLPIFLVSGIISAINAALILPIMLLHGDWLGLHLPAGSWIILIVVSVSSALFYVFWYLGADKVDATLASLSTAVMPIATVSIAWLALGEAVTLLEFIGMGLVIVSILIYAQGAKTRTHVGVGLVPTRNILL